MRGNLGGDRCREEQPTETCSAGTCGGADRRPTWHQRDRQAHLADLAVKFAIGALVGEARGWSLNAGADLVAPSCGMRRGRHALQPDQSLEVEDQVGEADLGRCPRQAASLVRTDRPMCLAVRRRRARHRHAPLMFDRWRGGCALASACPWASCGGPG